MSDTLERPDLTAHELRRPVYVMDSVHLEHIRIGLEDVTLSIDLAKNAYRLTSDNIQILLWMAEDSLLRPTWEQLEDEVNDACRSAHDEELDEAYERGFREGGDAESLASEVTP